MPIVCGIGIKKQKNFINRMNFSYVFVNCIIMNVFKKKKKKNALDKLNRDLINLIIY